MGKFTKGQSGNPGGRPAVPKEVRIAARGNTLDALYALREVMMSSKSPPAARVQAAAVWLRLAWGGAPLDLDNGQGESEAWHQEPGATGRPDPTEVAHTPALARILGALAELEPELRSRLAVQVNVGEQQVNVLAPTTLVRK